MNLNVEDQIANLEEKDAAKEQAGRKMFEALETIEAEISHGTDAEKCPNCIVNAALAAGREAGWGQ